MLLQVLLGDEVLVASLALVAKTLLVRGQL
jgi:hypothetical protein